MDEKIRRVIGPDDGLQFDLDFSRQGDQERGLAWGRGMVRLGGEPIWTLEAASPGHEAPLEWTWLDLLEFLAKGWPWLVLEEAYPIPVKPLFPGLLSREAEHRWENLPQAQVEREQDAVYRFLARHDLAMAMKGVFAPSLILLRQGQRYAISGMATYRSVMRPVDEVLDTLEAVGAFIAAVVNGHRHPRAEAALALWQTRIERLERRALELHTGMTSSQRKSLVGGVPEMAYWELEPMHLERGSELAAVARMSTRSIPRPTQQKLLGRLRQVAYIPTPELDAVSRRAVSEWAESGKPYEQGYELAHWLRRVQGLQPADRFEPSVVLESWKVRVERLEFESRGLDAIAAWGPRHGPVILLNASAGARPAHRYGERSTLAHEMGHLLVDREGALPLAEVLGGQAPEYAEKRARAFAAEVLLPREQAAQIVRNSASLLAAIRQLQEHYEVSEELVRWQILNSSAREQLTDDELAELEQIDDLGDF